MTSETPFQLVCRGLVGWHGDRWEESSHSSISAGAFGYDDEPHAREYPIAHGALVLDKRAVLEQRPGLAFSSPLPDGKLAAGQIDRLDTRGSMVAAAFTAPDAPRNAFGDLLGLAAAVRIARPAMAGPLDRVGLADFAAWWRFHGARVGFWNAERNAVDWEPAPAKPEALPGFPPAEPLALDL